MLTEQKADAAKLTMHVLALEELDEGQILQVHLNSGEPVRNVPRSVKEEGHQVLDLRENEDGTYELFIRKVGD